MKRRIVIGIVAALFGLPASAAELSETNWTGAYIGGHFGYEWGPERGTSTSGNALFPAGFSSSATGRGVLGGLQSGYNYQLGPWVIGIEGDYSWSSLNGDAISASPLVLGTTADSHGRLPWLADVTGRIGFAPSTTSLIYFKGGGVWTRAEANTTDTAGGAVTGGAHGSESRSGYLLGLGTEWAFATRWSAKVEYNYLDFGTMNVARFNNSTGTPSFLDEKIKMNVIKIGINYYFN